MPSYARKLITANKDEVASYLLTNRIVRRSWLCGKDQVSNIDYSYRKQWFEDRTEYLISKCFFMEMHSYAVMSNHYHCVVTTRPDLAKKATNEEIVDRWWRLFPRKILGKVSEHPPVDLANQWLSEPEWIEERRARLSNVSWFMARLAEYIARRANKEDGVTGRFWEGRFDSRLLLDADSVLRANLYVDLNPVNADQAIDALSEKGTSLRLRADESSLSLSKNAPYYCLYRDKKTGSAKSDEILLQFDVRTYINVIRRLIHAKFSINQNQVELPGLGMDYHSPAYSPFSMGAEQKNQEFAIKRGAKRANRRRRPKRYD